VHFSERLGYCDGRNLKIKFKVIGKVGKVAGYNLYKIFANFQSTVEDVTFRHVKSPGVAGCGSVLDLHSAR
jgi:hypothetical protein